MLRLADEDRPLILNKTNALALGAEYGKSFKDWIGKTVEIRKERVVFAGKQVEALRVYPERKRPAPRRTSAAGLVAKTRDLERRRGSKSRRPRSLARIILTAHPCSTRRPMAR